MSKMNLKKSIALTIALTMLLSLAAFFTIPVAAIDGNFDTHGRAAEEDENYDGEKNSIPGYEYTSDGFHMTSADWSTGTPFSHMSTKEKVDLKEGVYMQVRIDDFNYSAADKWVNFNLWSLPAIEVGSVDPSYGYGVQTLVRPSNGGFGTVSWYTNAFTGSGGSSIPDEYRYSVDGKNVLTLKVTYDGTNFAVEINGAPAPQKVIDYMNETYAEDSFAYVGFTMSSDERGGTQEATILKFGTSEFNAAVPQGDDEKYPMNYIIEYAEIADPSTVPAGQPAILMTGDSLGSDLKGTPVSNTGTRISISDDGLIHIMSNSTGAESGTWKVDNEISYDIQDFPVFMVMTKNYCSCAGDNGECWAYEEAHAYIACGDSLVPGPKNKYYADICYEPYFIDNGSHNDSYLYFIADLSIEAGEDGRFNGRINSTRVDFYIDINSGIAGANELDVVMQGFFASTEDAVNYAMAYLEDNGYSTDDDYDDDYDDESTESPEDTPVENRYYEGYSDGWTAGYNIAYENGFNDGFEGNYAKRFELLETPADPLSYDRGYSDGYNEAFQSVYSDAYSKGQEAYSYYQQGYNEGYEAGISTDVDYSEIYSEGYNEGYDNGYNEGYNRGFNDGEEVTREDLDYDQGFTEGYDKGYIDGYDKGVAENKEETSREPEGGDYQEGYDSGYSDGYKDGKKDGKKENNGNSSSNSSNNNGNNSTEYDRGYNDGYADGATDATAKISELLGGCEANLSSGAILLIATAIPSLYIFFKRKKND